MGSHCSRLELTSRRFLLRWVFKLVVPLVSILHPLAEPGTSLTPTVWVNRKSNWLISSSKVLPKSSSGNKHSRRKKILKQKLQRLPSPKNIDFFSNFSCFAKFK